MERRADRCALHFSDDFHSKRRAPSSAVAHLVLVRSMRPLVALAITTAIGLPAARGDMPLPPPSKVTVTSPSGRIRAISDPKTGTKVEDVKVNKVLWSLRDWHRSMFVADDGEHLVTQYDGLNLIPVDFTDNLALLTFWREGNKIREVTVGDLFPDHKGLVRTVSHYAWCLTIDFDAKGRLRVLRLDGTTWLFDVTTGDIVKT
jgi:hypothetical protein